MKEYVVGADLGGTTVKIGFFPRNEKLEYKYEIPTVRNNVADLYKSIADSILNTAKERGIEPSAIKAIGIDIPGPVDEKGFVPRLVNVGIGAHYPGAEIEKYSGIPAASLNDANAAALGEVKFGAAKGVDSAALFTLGTGVGGGVVVNGKVVAGKHGVAAEFGHFVVNPEEPLACNCGNHGCLEQYASATGVTRLAKKFLQETDEASSLRNLPDFGAKDVMDSAKAGDAIGLKVLDICAKYLAQVISYVIQTTDPELIILGGGMSKTGPILIDKINDYVGQFTHIATDRAKIVIAELSNDAGMYGAAAVAEEAIRS